MRLGGESQVPSCVAAGELEAGRHKDGGLAVQTLDQSRGRGADRRLAVAAVDRDAVAFAVTAVEGLRLAHVALAPRADGANNPNTSDRGLPKRRLEFALDAPQFHDRFVERPSRRLAGADAGVDDAAADPRFAGNVDACHLERAGFCDGGEEAIGRDRHPLQN